MTSIESHKKAKALKPGSVRPAKELCSECGILMKVYIFYSNNHLKIELIVAKSLNFHWLINYVSLIAAETFDMPH